MQTEDLVPEPSVLKVTHNHPQLQFRGFDVLSSKDARSTYGAGYVYKHVGKMFIHIKSI